MDFTAKWITGPAKIDRDSEVAPYLFRKQVTLPANVKSAVLYATALGVYSIFADNHKISDTYFAPGYTEYSQRLQYQEYDVTSLLSGKSSFVLTAELADGWYAGRLGLCNMENRYGEKRALLAQPKDHAAMRAFSMVKCTMPGWKTKSPRIRLCLLPNIPAKCRRRSFRCRACRSGCMNR